jgi:sentrin-specific protease 8
MNGPIVCFHESNLYPSDLKALRRGLLTSNCVDFILCHLEYDKYAEALHSDGKVTLLHPATSHMISMMDADDLVECLEGLELNQKDLVFVPINNATGLELSSEADRGSHWSLLVCDRGTSSATHYDSASGGNDSCARSAAQKMAGIFGAPLKYVVEHGVAQQENGFDCGMFACRFVDFFLARRFGVDVTPVSQQTVTTFRQSMFELAQRASKN